jgi:formylglycine-generating enzyme required for sulfatase activity
VDTQGVRNPPEKYTVKLFTEGLGAGAGLDMVLISGGSFTMGSPADEPERQANEGPHTMSRLLHSL